MRRLAFAVLVAAFALTSAAFAVVPPWNSPDHYRLLLTVNPRGVTRTNSPAAVDVDLPQALAGMGSAGTFDKDTIEVIAYSSAGAPRAYDASRAGYEKYLLPWRGQGYYPTGRMTLSFVVPDQTYIQYAVYFDTVQSGLGRPQRYAGLVGDGDWFREGYGRREIGPSHFDSLADFDGDGDLDYFKAGVEPFIYCYENVGGNRYVDRGRLTSGGNLFELPESGDHRSWVSIEFYDWDGDGDLDLFASFSDGPENGNVDRWQNMKHETGALTFVNRGRLLTQSGKALGSGWFGMITIVDWDGDGKKDVLAAREDLIEFHKNIGPDNDISNIQLADGVYLTANGCPISVTTPRVDCADMDGDGDLDLFVAAQGGPVRYFENVGTRTNPVLRSGRMLVYTQGGHTGVKAADLDGDGLKDFIYGRMWNGDSRCQVPRVYGRYYKNIGTPTAPRFEARDAYGGCPHTEEFQICDASRQNGVRATDWNNDGKMDLVGFRSDGWVWLFRNTTNRLFPVFAAGEPLTSQGAPVEVINEDSGYARGDVCDWNADGKKDLLLADGAAMVALYPNQGTDANPILGPRTQLYAGGAPIDGANRASVLYCDWDNDGKNDLVFADDSGYYWYKNTGTNANPVLAASKAVTFNGQTVTYSRPNLGSYVDWDGDGKKDFIGCEFENSIRFYKNTGTGGAGVEPKFANTNGVVIVQPYTVQQISGADARDWNGDGDLDIVTGQGHGGNGLRFYERDYINDFVNNTSPTVTVGSSEGARTIPEARAMANTPSVTVIQGTVTACYDTFFYIESPNRESGIRVDLAGHGRSIGDQVDVRGALGTSASGERYIAATSIVVH